MNVITEIVNSQLIHHTLKETRREYRPDAAREVLERARRLQGLTVEDAAVLLVDDRPEVQQEVLEAAAQARATVHGSRVNLFAPLNLSNFCCNECQYCAFRVRNKQVDRRALVTEEIGKEAAILAQMGHRHVEVACGAVYPDGMGFEYVTGAIAAIRRAQPERGQITRIDVNVPPLEVDEFHALAGAGIGAYLLVQESYHKETYQTVHVGGPKRDYDYRIGALHRAMEGGLKEIGIGVLFGLYDWRFEVMGLVDHARTLRRDFGRGPAALSVPRVEAAPGSGYSEHPAQPVSDADYLRALAVLRLALPQPEMVLTTTESAALRQQLLRVGVTSVSAAARCEPGGYSAAVADAQLQLGDHRPLPEVVSELTALGYTPVF